MWKCNDTLLVALLLLEISSFEKAIQRICSFKTDSSEILFLFHLLFRTSSMCLFHPRIVAPKMAIYLLTWLFPPSKSARLAAGRGLLHSRPACGSSALLKALETSPAIKPSELLRWRRQRCWAVNSALSRHSPRETSWRHTSSSTGSKSPRSRPVPPNEKISPSVWDVKKGLPTRS